MADAQETPKQKPAPKRRPASSKPDGAGSRKAPVAARVVELNALERVSAYARDVIDGRIVAGPHVRNACRRHFADLEHGPARGIFFDIDAAQHLFTFFEKGLTLSEGQFEGIPFILHPSQAFILGSLFGWMIETPDGTITRRFRRAYIEMGKGNGKSPLAGGIGLYGMMADNEAGAQIYAAAAKKEQAGILFQDACKMVRRSPKIYPKVKFSGGIGKEFNIAHHASASFFRPISKESGKSGSGPRPHFALCDEVHEHPDRAIMEMLERGFKARLSPLLLMMTNSGSDKNSVCWEEHEHAAKVCAGTATPDDDFTFVGEPIDDTAFGYVCSLDKDDNPLEDPECWAKANPMLGVILKHDYIAGVVKQAKQMPGKRNGILRLHFCVWTDSANGWIGRELIESAMEEFDPYVEHVGKDVAVGIDLSATRDLTAAAFTVETGFKEVNRYDDQGHVEDVVSLPTYDLWIEAWKPKDTIAAAQDADKAPYVLWAEQGYLRSTPGGRIRNDHIAHFLISEIDSRMNIIGIAYDRYAYDKFKEECDNRGFDVKHVAHPQGGKVRGKVDPEEIEAAKANKEEPPLGLWMPGSVKALEEAIADGRVRIRRSPLVMTALMGAALEGDAQDNRWFVKSKASVRIDPAVAGAMSIGLIVQKPIVKKAKQYQMIVI